MIAHSNAAAQVKNAEANLKKANLAETAATQKKDELVAQKANAPRDNRPSLVSSEATLLDKIEALQKEAETITVDPIDGVKQELDDATIMITNFDEWVRNKDKIIAQENEIITEKTKEIAETKDQLAVTRNKIDMRKSAQGHVKMLRNYRVVETSQQLEAGMNEIIHCVFPDYVVRLEQTSTGVKFFYSHTTSATSKTNNWLGAKMSSGFERSLLNAAFRLTLCREYGLPICLLDEIDGHADDDSSQALYEFIFSCGLFQQSFIISHKKIIKNTVVDLDLGAYIYEAKGGKFRRVS
jgi:chromosome segregation ATPase